MSDVRVTINGRSYDIACDSGAEDRVVQLASYVDQRVHAIARSGAAYNDAHLLILTTLMLADELFDAREGKAAQAAKTMAKTAQAAVQPRDTAADDEALAKIIAHLAERVSSIASKVEAA